MMAQGMAGRTLAPYDSSAMIRDHTRARKRGDKGSGALKPRCKTRQWTQGDGKATSKGFNGDGRALLRQGDPKQACV